MALSKIQNNSYADTAVHGRRNLIINGAMNVWQRATAATTVTNGTYQTVDRFKFWESTAGSYTVERSTTVPSGQGFGYSAKLTVTGTDTSMDAADYAQFAQCIEAQDLQQLAWGTASAKTLTLSFWVRSSKTGTYTITVQKFDNTTYTLNVEYSISAADTWEFKEIEITPDANIKAAGGAFDNDNGLGIRLFWNLAFGSDYYAPTNNTWSTNSAHFGTSNQVNWLNETNTFYITGVQLEVGSQATPFEHRSFGEELALCQRYYSTSYNYGVSAGTASATQGCIYKTMDATTSYGSENFSFPVKMRTNPTVTSYSPNSGTSGKFDTNTAGAVSDRDIVLVNVGHFGSAGQANNQSVSATAFMRFHYTADAEL